jgi:hypothetical protein
MRLSQERDDSGSAMIIAVTVVLVITTLSLGMLARSLNGLSTARRQQDFAGALGAADAGLSDALFRLDQVGVGAVSGFCVGPSCTVGALPDHPGVIYKATVVDNNTMTIRSRGTVNGIPHAMEATIRRDGAYPFAIFGNSSLTFNGNSGGNIYSVDASGTTVATPEADAGSNGTITCNGSSPAQHHVVYSGGSTNCSFPINATGSYTPQDPVTSCPAAPNTPTTPCLPATYTACPAGGNFPSVVIPAAYYCTSSVTMPSTVSVGAGSGNGGVVEIFIIPSSGTADFNMPGSDVNVGGDPTKFRVYLAGAGNVVVGNGANAGNFTGIMFAPNSSMTSNGCKVGWRGALVFNTATCNGGPHLSVQYDTRVAALVQQNWSVHNYHEIPSSQVVVP